MSGSELAAQPDASSAIVDRFGVTFSAVVGLPATAGRLFATLLLSERAMSQQELRVTLAASEGAVSEGTRALIEAGLLERAPEPAGRPYYFRVRDDAWSACSQHTLTTVRALRELAESSHELVEDPSSMPAVRLRQMLGMYAYLEREMPALLERAIDAAAAEGARPVA